MSCHFFHLRASAPAHLCLLAALAISCSPQRTWAWGCDGHQAVARIAEKHMSAHALEQANRLLEGAPIDATLPRRCWGRQLDPMADASTWADDVRALKPETSPWHYIDIPRNALHGRVENYCPASTGCVTSAIEHEVATLRTQNANSQARAEALRFVIHFVADLHQPLHCVTDNDLGANCVPIEFFGAPPIEKNPQSESYAPNLHGIWDSSLIERMKGEESVARWADAIDRQFSSQSKSWVAAGIYVDEWAWQSHELADSMAYGKLPVEIPAEPPRPVRGCYDDGHVAMRRLRLHERVSQEYLDAVAPTIDQQLAKAGVRLAMILNQVWP